MVAADDDRHARSPPFAETLLLLGSCIARSIIQEIPYRSRHIINSTLRLLLSVIRRQLLWLIPLLLLIVDIILTLITSRRSPDLIHSVAGLRRCWIVVYVIY